jgi:hypothetical protein
LVELAIAGLLLLVGGALALAQWGGEANSGSSEVRAVQTVGMLEFVLVAVAFFVVAPSARSPSRRRG